MYVKAVRKAQKAMFPIFRFENLNNGQFRVGVTGTGYFINPNGYMITVAHIFSGEDKISFKYCGELPESLIQPPLEIEEIARDDYRDIFIGKISIKNKDYFRLNKKITRIGRSVCIAGYPLAQITENPQGGLELGGVRRYFQPSFVLDFIKNKFNDEKGINRFHDGFLMRDVGLFGMSGGPILDVKGKALGMMGSFVTRESVNALNKKIEVQNAVAIGSNVISNFLREKKIKLSYFF
ncbi:MAG: serine protease [Patescibacteria group bacterium]|jgi:hypothetical protein